MDTCPVRHASTASTNEGDEVVPDGQPDVSAGARPSLAIRLVAAVADLAQAQFRAFVHRGLWRPYTRTWRIARDFVRRSPNAVVASAAGALTTVGVATAWALLTLGLVVVWMLRLQWLLFSIPSERSYFACMFAVGDRRITPPHDGCAVCDTRLRRPTPA